MLPFGKKYPEQNFQFVHVDDVARLLVYLLHRPFNDPPVTILNVAAHGEPLSIQTCAQIAQATIRRVPSRSGLPIGSADALEVGDFIDPA